MSGVIKKKQAKGFWDTGVIFRWRSSLWKLLWKELLVYTILYLMISLFYRFSLTYQQQLIFEKLIDWCAKHYTGLPLTFILGFYVTLIVNRWWSQYGKLPWPDTVAIYLRSLLPGSEEEPTMIRRTVIRYCLLSYILCVRRMSARLMKRFPSMSQIVKTGLIRMDEVDIIGEEDMDQLYESNWWMPLKWSVEILSNAQKKGLVVSAPGFAGLTGQIAAFRSSLTGVATYGHIPVPLVYTQVVTLAVYIYFGVSLVGEQWIIHRNPGDEIDLWYPIFMTVKFLFYFGWLRVAETLYNPFGEDDDDFELNELINRHFRVAMSIVDQVEEPPKLQKDTYWGQANPELVEIPGWTFLAASVDTKVILSQNGSHETLCNTEKRDAML